MQVGIQLLYAKHKLVSNTLLSSDAARCLSSLRLASPPYSSHSAVQSIDIPHSFDNELHI